MSKNNLIYEVLFCKRVVHAESDFCEQFKQETKRVEFERREKTRLIRGEKICSIKSQNSNSSISNGNNLPTLFFQNNSKELFIQGLYSLALSDAP